jgi:superfamily II RNA helicase
LRAGPFADFQDVVMDEFHYYADRERGVAWQAPLLTLPHTRFLLMSATLGETAFFEEQLTKLNGVETVTVRSADRPVPLEWTYAETPLAQTLENLLSEGKGPVYVVHFTQADAAESAQNFTSIPVSSRERKAAISHELEGFRFSSPYGPDIKKWLRHGIGLHHAGLLPKYRLLVERLAQKGLLSVICGTDTLGVGINVPIRTVLFTRLCKYDGQKTAILTARDFHQISGRAGRKGFDDLGWVVTQAPEHVIENLLLEQKKAGGGKKFVKRKPPEKNFVNWDKQTFTRLIAATPERLTSQFRVSHGMLLNVLSRDSDGCTAMRNLIRDSHESAKGKKAHVKRAWQLFRALLDRQIVELIPETAAGAKLRVNVALQDDFSMDRALSLYLVETIGLLDSQALDYPMVLVTLVESILEDPEIILRKQLDRVKDEAIAEMKAEGLEYEQRMAELEKLEYPKPNREFVYSTFNEFAARHPWVGEENIRPKSIAREMFEQYRSFADTIEVYGLHRVEGLLLRHLSAVHKVLMQTVPDSAKTDEVFELEIYLGAMLKQVDSSLLDEWEKLRDPNFQSHAASAELRPPGAEEAARDITRDRKAFVGMIRNRIFTFLRAFANGDGAAALQELAPSSSEINSAAWTADQLRRILEEHGASRGRIRLDPEARNARNTHIEELEQGRRWRVQQMLVDTEDANDWVAELEVELPASQLAGEPVISLSRIGPLA